MPLRSRLPKHVCAATVLPVCGFLYFLIRYPSFAYFAAGAMVLTGFFGLYAGWDRWGKGSLGIPALAAAGLGLPALGILQFHLLRDLGDFDQCFYSVALWNFRHGTLHYSYLDTNILGIHSQY